MAAEPGTFLGRPPWMAHPLRLSPDALGEHADRLYRAAWALCGSREDAEDLVQETFARVLARPRFVRQGTAELYLLRALRNTFLDVRRSSARRPHTELLPEDSQLHDHPRSDPANGHVQHEALFSAIAALPGDHRDALVAVDIAGLSYREAAKALRVREETLATRLFRARQQVTRRMKDEDPDLERRPVGVA